MLSLSLFSIMPVFHVPRSQFPEDKRHSWRITSPHRGTVSHSTCGNNSVCSTLPRSSARLCADIFRNVEVLIYVFDVESRELQKDLRYYRSCLEAILQNSKARTPLLSYTLTRTRSTYGRRTRKYSVSCTRWTWCPKTSAIRSIARPLCPLWLLSSLLLPPLISYRYSKRARRSFGRSVSR